MKCLLKTAFFLLFPLALWAQFADPFQYSVDLSPVRLSPGGETEIEINFLIPPDHYLYKDKMGLSLTEGGDFELGTLELSPSTSHKDPFTGEEEDIYERTATLRAPLRVPETAKESKREVRLELTYQGCSSKLCYRFTRKELALPVLVGPVSDVSEDESAVSFFDDPVEAFRKKGFLFAVLVTFLGGLGSAFTPCVLPIIPITLAFIGVRKQDASIAKNFLLTLCLVLSMSLTYALLGLAAALLGKSLGFLFQSPYFLIFSIAIYTAFSLSLFGLFEIQVPMGMRNALAKLGGAGVAGSVLSGFTVGFLAAPCVGPIIGALLLYVAKERDVVHGFSLLFVYGMGIGFLFLIIGTFYHRLASKVRGGPFTVWIRRAFAVLLLAPALYYGSVVFAQLTSTGPKTATEETGSFWILSPQEGLERARASNKPVFMDFYASWCFPCVEMEKGTFSEPGFQKFLSERFLPIKVDCTKETPDCRAMVERFGVVGWPTFLILTSEGQVVRALVGQSLTASELENILRELLSNAKGER